jgi:2-methylisocitrate lyase-like PEP mutase family enzyme
MIRHPDAFAETVRRAERYLAAGADCIFVPGVTAAEEIGRLTAAIGAPVNVVAGLVEPVLDAATLRALGVARISVGGTLSRAALTLVEKAAREMADHGTFGFAQGAIPYAALQQRFSLGYQR